MATRLGLFCNRIIEAGWLVALVVVPLHFNPATSRVFEPDKIALLRSLAVIMAVAWLVKAGEGWWARRGAHGQASTAPGEAQPAVPRRALAAHPLVVIVALSLVSYALSTVLSILPEVSLWGYYGRLHGLYTASAYLVIFFSALALLRTEEQVQRIVSTVVVVSVPMALYGVLQHLGLDPLVWVEPVSKRVHGTMGNPIFLAAALCMVVPLTGYRLVVARRVRQWMLMGSYGLVLAVQLAAIVFAQSRGPVLGLLVGLLIGGLVWMLAQRRWRAAKGLVALTVVLMALVALLNLSDTLLAAVEEVPYLNRLVRVDEGEGSTEGRVLVWEGAVRLLGADPARLVAGYGPEVIRFAYYPYYTTTLAQIHGERVFFDRMHNETFDVLVTTGLLGLSLYLLLLTGLVYYGLRWMGLLPTVHHRYGFIGLWAAGGLGAVLVLRWVAQTWALSGVGVPLGVLGGLVLYLAGYAFFEPRRTAPADGPPSPKRGALLLVVLFAAIVGHVVETNVGIAVSATRLLFWVYVAAFFVVGVVWPARPEAADAGTPPASRPAYGSLLVMSQGVGFIALTLVYSFFVGEALTEHGGVMAVLLGASWLLAGLFLVLAVPPHEGRPPYGRALGRYVGLSVLPLSLMLVFVERDVGVGFRHLVLYLLIVLVFLLATALLLRRGAPPARRATVLGLVLAVAGSIAGAMVLYTTNVQLVRANMHHRQAKTDFAQRQYDEATIQYQRALDLDRQELYRLELAQLLATRARYQARIAPAEREQLFRMAEDLLVRASAENPYEQYHYAALADVYLSWAKTAVSAPLRQTRYEQAFSAFAQALRINPANTMIRQRWAAAYEEQGDRHRALDTYRAVLAEDSTNVELYLTLGTLYRDDQQWAEAALMYEGALRHSTQPRPSLHQLLATLYLRLDRLDEAARAGERAVALGPDLLASRAVLIGVYERLGRCREAHEQLRAALQRWPGDARLLARAASVQRQCPQEPAPG